MDDLNLTNCEPISREELEEGNANLRRQLASARMWAVHLEQEVAHLEQQLAAERATTTQTLSARLTAHGIPHPDDPEGVPV